jgi:hypothetical protein
MLKSQTKQQDTETFETVTTGKGRNRAALLRLFKVSVRATRVQISYNGESWDHTAL